jgi:O-antigen/teichoic acid export membrane protein
MSTHEPSGGGGLDDALNRRIVRSSAWVGVGFGGARLLSFASTLVLVRLLAPEAFGIVAVGMTLLAVVTQIQESGLGAALVHSRRYDPRTAASSVLAFAALAGLALTALTVLLAPLYTRLLHVPEATEEVRVLALLLAVRGLAVVPGALLERELDFRSRTVGELSGAVVQAAVAIASAAGGLGAWSLVAGQLSGTSTLTAVLWLRAPWRPSPLRASRRVLVDLLRYGRFVSGTNVMVIVNTNLDNVAVARFLGAGPLGVYNVAWRLAELPNTVIALVVGRVMFSVYSRLQHDLAAVRAAYVQNLQRTMLLALPVTVTLGLGAEPIVLGLLGDAWEGAVGPLRLLAVFGFVRLLAGPSGELFKGIGRPHLTLVSASVFFAAALPGLLVLVPRLETTGAALAMVLAISCSGSVALGLTFSRLSLRPVELLAALARPIACASLVAAGVLAVLPATERVGSLAGLGLVAAASGASFAASLALLARPLLAPIWAALRRT